MRAFALRSSPAYGPVMLRVVATSMQRLDSATTFRSAQNDAGGSFTPTRTDWRRSSWRSAGSNTRRPLNKFQRRPLLILGKHPEGNDHPRHRVVRRVEIRRWHIEHLGICGAVPIRIVV